MHPALALQRLRGTTEVAEELAELEEERIFCQGRRALRPWELFQDRGLRRQVTSLMVLGSALELCGTNSVRLPAASFNWLGVGGLQTTGSWQPTPLPPCPGVAYASSVFRQAGIPEGKVQYAIVGTGSCELLVACVSVSLSEFVVGSGVDPPPALWGWGCMGC